MKRYIGLFSVVALAIAGTPAPAAAQPAPDEWNVLVAVPLSVEIMTNVAVS